VKQKDRAIACRWINILNISFHLLVLKLLPFMSLIILHVNLSKY
jgi:hypothetical protein